MEFKARLRSRSLKGWSLSGISLCEREGAWFKAGLISMSLNGWSLKWDFVV